MASGVKRYGCITDTASLAVFNRVEINLAKAMLHDRPGEIGSQIPAVAAAGVVGVAVGDQGPVYRSPRIDIEIPGWAINAFSGKGQDRSTAHGGNLGLAAGKASIFYQGLSSGLLRRFNFTVYGICVWTRLRFQPHPNQNHERARPT